MCAGAGAGASSRHERTICWDRELDVERVLTNILHEQGEIGEIVIMLVL